MHIFQLVDRQLKERYKHFIIFGPPFQGKTKLGKQIAEEKDGLYLDLLLEFQAKQGLKEEIDIFGPEKLKKYIKELKIVNSSFIVIDHMDFLIHTWDKGQIQEFITFVEMDESNGSYLFIMQDYKILSTIEIKNDKGNKRVINIFDIKEGGILND